MGLTQSRLASIALVTVVFGSLPAWSATVTSVTGTVMINRGNGFQQVVGTVEANVGDSVTASPGATGQVVYSDGCPVEISPGSVVTIAAKSPCQALAQQDPPQDTTSPLLVTAAVVAVVATVAIVLSNQDDDAPAPASP